MTAIAAVSAPFDRDLERCFATVERYVSSARERGAGLVVFPEGTLGGHLREPVAGEHAPELPQALDPDGPEIERLVRIAGDSVVCAGYTEAGAGGELYSAAVCVSGDGVLGRHRKVHLPPAERFAYLAGDGFEAFDTPAGRVGMVLCYDKLFPEAARALALDGAELIASMAAWPLDRRRPAAQVADDRQVRHFDAIDVARAIENQVVWVSSNQCGRWGPVTFLGGAKVVCPDGAVVAGTGTQAGLACAQLDVEGERAAVRLDVDHLADRQPLAYAPPAAAAARAV